MTRWPPWWVFLILLLAGFVAQLVVSVQVGNRERAYHKRCDRMMNEGGGR